LIRSLKTKAQALLPGLFWDFLHSHSGGWNVHFKKAPLNWRWRGALMKNYLPQCKYRNIFESCKFPELKNAMIA